MKKYIYPKPDVTGIVESWTGREPYFTYSDITKEDGLIEILSITLALLRNVVSALFYGEGMFVTWASSESSTDLEKTVFLSVEPIKNDALTYDEKFAAVLWSSAHESGELVFNDKNVFNEVRNLALHKGVNESLLQLIDNLIGDVFVNREIKHNWPGFNKAKKFAYWYLFSDVDSKIEALLEFDLKYKETYPVRTPSESESNYRAMMTGWVQRKLDIYFSALVGLCKLEISTNDVPSEKVKKCMQIVYDHAHEDMKTRVAGSWLLLKEILSEEEIKFAVSEPTQRMTNASSEGGNSGKFVVLSPENTIDLGLLRKIEDAAIQYQENSAEKDGKDTGKIISTKTYKNMVDVVKIDYNGKGFLSISDMPIEINVVEGFKATNEIAQERKAMLRIIGNKHTQILWRATKRVATRQSSYTGNRVNNGKLYRMSYGDPRVLAVNKIQKPDYVDILFGIDCSGSMNSRYLGNRYSTVVERKYILARQAALALYLLFEKTRIVNLWVYTHNYVSSTVQIKNLISPRMQQKDKYNNLIGINSMGSNADGVAAAAIFKDFIAQSNAQQKVCYWFFDGLPVTDDHKYSGQMAVDHTAQVFTHFAKKFPTIGVLLDPLNSSGIANAKKIFGENLVEFDTVKQFINDALALLNSSFGRQHTL